MNCLSSNHNIVLNYWDWQGAFLTIVSGLIMNCLSIQFISEFVLFVWYGEKILIVHRAVVANGSSLPAISGDKTEIDV